MIRSRFAALFSKSGFTAQVEITGVTTILDAFVHYAEDYGIDIITDKKKAKNADVVLLCAGEQGYA